MHGRVIQIEADPKDLMQSGLGGLCDSLIDSWFVHSIADYVCEDPDRDQTIEDFEAQIDLLLPSATDAYGRSFVLGNEREVYLNGCFNTFREHLEKLNKATFEDFMGGFMKDFDAMKNAHSDKYGTYIYSFGWGLETVQDFLRRAEPGTRYYYGDTADYHW